MRSYRTCDWPEHRQLSRIEATVKISKYQ